MITPVALGCWPIAGITSLDVTEQSSLDTLAAAVDAGINFLDTAYCYGYEGESERLIARALGHRRNELVIATKCGIHWENRKQAKDGRPATLRRECEESLRRLGTDYVDLLYLHAPDPAIAIEESAEALRQLQQEGLTRSVGLSNASTEQLERFHRICPLAAYQPHYNLLQREIEQAELPWCVAEQVSVIVYWPLLKGLLSGHLRRDHQFDERDGRKKYPMFQGAEWQWNQDFVDELRAIASGWNCSLTELVVAWTIAQPGITAALCGAKRPEQIRESAGGMSLPLSAETLAAIDQALQRRGQPLSQAAVAPVRSR